VRPAAGAPAASREGLDMSRAFLFLGGANAFIAVAFGAFGAHGLKGRIADDILAAYQTGVLYHFFHALGLFLVGVLARSAPQSSWLKGGGAMLAAGVLLFCGSLYVMGVTGYRPLGMVTPVGGVSFLAGWLLVCVAVLKEC